MHAANISGFLSAPRFVLVWTKTPLQIDAKN